MALLNSIAVKMQNFASLVPNTGDETKSNTGLYIALGIAAVVVIGGVVAFIVKKKMDS